MKKIIKLLSVFLTMLFCVQVIPAISYRIFAADFGLIRPNLGGEVEETAIATILYEDAEKRNEKEKHFVMSDGTVTAVIYSEPVHYLSDEGEWKDIDNTLKYEEADKSLSKDFDGYVTSNSDFKVKLAGDLSDGTLFTIGSDDDFMAWSLADEISSDAPIVLIKDPVDEEQIGDEIKAVSDSLSSKAEYKDALNGADLSYKVISKSIKEDIVINEKSDEYEYSFIMRSDALVPKTNDDGSISIYCGEEEKYIIPVPFMYDAGESYSNSVRYELNKIDEGAYSLKIIADDEWINDPETAFPVTIDPTIHVSTGYYGLHDAYVSSANPTTTYGNSPTVNVGKSNSSTYRLYMEVTQLPELKSTDVLVSAKLRYEYINGTATKPYYAYNVADSVWSCSSVTWNNQPQTENNPAEYVTKKTNNGLEFDLTRLADEWYTDGKTNHGIMIKSDESQTYYVQLLSARNGTMYSYFAVNYRTDKCIDSQLSYTTIDAGESGTVYVNNQSGLIILTRDDISSAGQTMPFRISHMYWGILNRTSYVAYMRVGLGWRLNIQETVDPISNIGYVYIDSNGVNHYFFENNNTYTDEDGLGMTLTVETNGFTITFSDGSEKSFETMGITAYLVSETNFDGKTITYTYDSNYSGRIISVTDPDGESATFQYSGNNLSSITYNGRTISYAYDSLGKLSSISDTLTGGVVATYAYDSSDPHGELASTVDRTGMTVFINYGDGTRSIPYNTNSVKWKYSANGTENGAEFSYNKGDSTTVLYYGLDAVKNTSDDINTTYVFDHYGRAINVYNEDVNGIVLGTNITGYSGNTSLNGNNNISKLASTGVQNENLVNGTFSASDNTVSLNTSNDEFYLGNSSTELEITSASDKAGMEKSVALAAGTYTLSAYVKSTDGVTNEIGIWIDDASDNEIVSEFSISETNADIDNGWERIYVTFTLSSAENVTLGIGVNNGGGTVYVDGIKLEKSNGFAPSAYNMLSNPGFESGTISWSGVGTVSSAESKSGASSLSIVGDITTEKKESQTVTLGYIPKNSYVVSGWAKASSIMNEAAVFGLEATVTYKALGSDSIMYTGLTKTTLIPFSKETTDWQYMSDIVEMPQTYEDDSTGIIYYVKEITSITVSVAYSNNINTAYFDDISLVQSSAVMIDYDESGNIASFTVDNEESNEFEYEEGTDKLLYVKKKDGTIVEEYIYDNDDNLLTVKDGEGTVIRSYTYDANGNLLSSTEDGETTTYTYFNDLISSVTANGVTTSYIYDANERQTGTSKTASINGTTCTLNDSSSVLNILGLTTSETNSRGKIVSYTHDSQNRTASVTDANGNVLRYTYTTAGNLACEYVDADNDGVFDSGERYVSYTYDSLGKISGIDANGITYTLTCNEAGLPYQVKVGNTPIATCAYTADYSKQTSVTYANGLTESYIYDILGNVKEYVRGNNTVCTYEYDGNGNLIKKNDSSAGKTTEYIYNAAGEKLSERISSASNDLFKYVTERTDAGNSDISYTDKKYVLNGTEMVYTTQYDSSDDTTKYILPTSAEITSETDVFDRLSSRSIKDSNDNDILTYTYSYENRTDNNLNYTSNAVSGVSISDGTSYSYTYDDNGNITSVTRQSDPFYNYISALIAFTASPQQTTYEYDELGELVRENNPIAGKTWTYSYDNNGNILSKSEYSYTTGTLPVNPNSVKNYSYGNSTWKDQLTQYGSQTISYDLQGNPTNWKNGEALTWSGRQLTSWDDGEDIYTFTYDEAGYRTKTYINGSPVEYVYDDDGNILKGKNTTYYYDESGCPIGFKFNNTIYYYQFNEQGDVTGFVEESGTLVYLYEYDAWGNIIDTEYMTIRDKLAGNNNIYRYRGKYGYVYEKDLDLYYLQTRFYDPKVGRFLNEDDASYICASGTTLGGNLYAFCEGNPQNYIDINGNWIYTLKEYQFLLSIVYPYPIATVGEHYYYKIRNEASINRINPPRVGNYIFNQRDPAYKNIKINGYDLAGHGCEIVAIYNSMIYLHQSKSLYSIILEMIMNDQLFLGGAWGIWPTNIGNYYKAHWIKYYPISSYKSFYNYMTKKKYGCCVISYWNSNPPWNGLHTVFVTYTSSNGKLSGLVYNLDSGSIEYSFSKLLNYARNRFIYAYMFI